MTGAVRAPPGWVTDHRDARTGCPLRGTVHTRGRRRRFTVRPAAGGYLVTRVVVADDQDLVRAGFSLILERNGIDVVGEARDGPRPSSRRCGHAARRRPHGHPDAPPRRDRGHAADRLPAPGCRVLVLTTFDLDEYVYAAVRAGASGFLLKDAPPADLVHAVDVVQRGDVDALLRPSPAASSSDSHPTPDRPPTHPAAFAASPSASSTLSGWSPRACPTPRSVNAVPRHRNREDLHLPHT